MEKPPRLYLPTLDGWRAIAVLLVICFHDRIHQLGPISTEFLHRYGDRGVNLFFAISGFLITYRLLHEESTTGKIDLRLFYQKRLFRIQPAALTYLGILVCLGIFLHLPVNSVGVFASVFMFRNYLRAKPDAPGLVLTNHYWSLSVEEHFYLVMPGLLLLVKRHRVKFFALLSLLFLVWHTLATSHGLLRGLGQWPNNRTDLRINALLIPSMVAVLYARGAFKAAAVKYLKPWVGIAFMVVSFVLQRVIDSPITSIVSYASMALLLVSTVCHPVSLLSILLESKPMRAIGHLSYSLYLWQQLFFVDRSSETGIVAPLGVLSRLQWPLNALCLCVCSLLSYTLVERPGIRLGQKLAAPHQSG